MEELLKEYYNKDIEVRVQKDLVKELLAAGIGAFVSYWIPSRLQKKANEKFGVTQEYGTYASSYNGFYTAGTKLVASFKLLGGIQLFNGEEINISQNEFVAGITLLLSAGYSAIESHYRERKAKKEKSPVPGLVVIGGEKIWELTSNQRKKIATSLESMLI